MNLTVPILTEEYEIKVLIGKRGDVIKQVVKYIEQPEKEIKEMFTGRGCAIDGFQFGCYPIIMVDEDMEQVQILATLAHEASHCMDYIQAYLGIQDMSGEIHAHGVASVMRHVLPKLLK